MALQESASTSSAFERRPYHGSCHCGTIKYIAYLTLPPSESSPDVQTFRQNSGLSIYKCNCTVCHKMGIFHLRLASAPDDFMLLSPTDPDAEGSGVSKYMCNAQKSSWFFCATCGVRCFTVLGHAENVEVELPTTLLQGAGMAEGKSGDTKKVKIWKLVKDGFKEGPRGNSYFSINAITLNAGQEGLDLREVHEKGWVAYVDSLERKGEQRVGKPHTGGMY